MKKIIIIFLFLVIILLSCNRETFELPSTQKQSTEILQNSLNKSKQNDNKNLQEFLKNKEKNKIPPELETIEDEKVQQFFFTKDPNPPLFAKDGQLYDSQNKQVQLKWVNWFWFAWDSRIPGWLRERNYKDIIKQMRDLWFNAVRLPFCPNTLKKEPIKDFWYVNPELTWKNSLEAFDIIIQEFTDNKMFVLLDMHTPDCKEISDTPFIPWYTLENWIEDWTFLVHRYKENKYVFWVDPKNEPHGDAVWNDTSDISINRKFQVETIAKEILKINPDLLIFVEWIEKNHPRESEKYDCEPSVSQSWWGNIHPIQCYPINEKIIPKDKLVLSPHIYGPSVYPRDYFESKDFPINMEKIWEDTFWKFYLQYTIILWEFWWDFEQKDKIWQIALIDYMKKKKLNNFFYWSWNPDSTDTKWLVKDDWISVEKEKYENLKKMFQ